MATRYRDKALQEDLNLGIGTGTKRHPAGGTLVGTQIGIHSFARGQAKASVAWDPVELPVGGRVSNTVTVLGAELGDFVLRSFSLDVQGLTFTADVTAPNVVTVTFANLTSGPVNLESGIVAVVVLPSR